MRKIVHKMSNTDHVTTLCYPPLRKGQKPNTDKQLEAEVKRIHGKVDFLILEEADVPSNICDYDIINGKLVFVDGTRKSRLQGDLRQWRADKFNPALIYFSTYPPPFPKGTTEKQWKTYIDKLRDLPAVDLKGINQIADLSLPVAPNA